MRQFTEHLRRRHRLRRARASFGLAASILVLAGLVVSGAAIRAGLPELRYRGASSAATSSPADDDLTLVASGDGWTAFADATFDPAEDIPILAWDSPQPAIEFVNQRSGAVTARVAFSSSPGAVIRQSRDELLVTDISWPEHSTTYVPARLLVLDLTDRFRLKAERTLPNRAESRNTPPQLVLSNDESRVAYIEYTFDLETPRCAAGDAPSPVECDQFRLMVVDLDAAPSPAGEFRLPDGCYPSISSTVGERGFVVKCRGGDVFVFGDEVELLREASLAGQLAEGTYHHEDWMGQPFQADLVAVFVIDEDRLVGLTRDGVWLTETERIQVLPEETWANRPRRLDDDRIVLPFAVDRTSLASDGLVIMNLRTGAVERTARFDRHGTPMAQPNGDLLLLGDGQLSLLAVGRATSEFLGAVHPDAEEFVY